ncbi:hypothetical protein DPM19_32680 [Actinomadura craniellae]|uniref:Histidine kinase/HSP90-like ATPase domain-containing protein n=1 Tax=Actinomadura craniellae TaxID=2231787 RepID=A0A365GW74_9ACTN|nr:ATP-binding protein [Actinomadura craniellae]RAY11060.1 hypothetical protein DPM19_32680 [Actinomadura craniellae]
MVEEDLRHLGAGAFPVWALPPDESGAGFARAVVRSVFGGLGFPAEVTYDVAVVASELATNVHRHAYAGRAPAGERGPGWPEVWAYLRWKPCPQVVVKVFDAAPWLAYRSYTPVRPPAQAEGGRGLELVDALTAEHGGQWGVHRTRSRLGDRPVPGKAVYLTLPLPTHRLPPAHPPALQATTQTATRMHTLLSARGLGRIHGAHHPQMAVLCVRPGVHVWIRPDALTYRTPGHSTHTHPPHDTVEVTEQIVRHCTEHDDHQPRPGSSPKAGDP